MSNFDEFMKNNPEQQKALAEAMVKQVTAYMEIGIQALPESLKDKARDETSELHATLRASAVMAMTSELAATKAMIQMEEDRAKITEERTKFMSEMFGRKG